MGEPRIYTAEEAKALRAAATSGPWRAGHSVQGRMDDDWNIYNDDGCDVTSPTGTGICAEDAGLLAAAPDLAASVAHHAQRADAAELASENARYEAEVKHKEEITRLLDIIAGVEMVEVPRDDGWPDHRCPFCGSVKWMIHRRDRWGFHAPGCAWVEAQEVNRG